jgi:hypothetical protein
MWEGDYLKAAFFWFAGSEGIPLQGEYDALLG